MRGDASDTYITIENNGEVMGNFKQERKSWNRLTAALRGAGVKVSDSAFKYIVDDIYGDYSAVEIEDTGGNKLKFRVTVDVDKPSVARQFVLPEITPKKSKPKSASSSSSSGSSSSASQTTTPNKHPTLTQGFNPNIPNQ